MIRDSHLVDREMEELRTEEEKRTREKLFRLTPGEEGTVNNLVSYAHKAGYIAKPTFQELMVFAIRCAYAYLKQDYDQRRGVR